MAVELQGQLLAQERELDSREGAIIMWEEGLVAFACTLGEVCAERDASRACADVVPRDFFTQVRASSSWSKQLTDLGRMLEEHEIPLCMQGMEAILSKELERSLHPSDGRDLSVAPNKAHTSVNGIDGEHATEAERLSWQVVRIFSVLVNLGMLPVQDIQQCPKAAQEVLPLVNLILKHLQEVLATSTGLWD
jgi:hypothetical protein